MSDLNAITNKNKETLSLHQILESLITVDKHLDLKTEVSSPLSYTRLYVLSKYLGITKNPKCEILLDLTLNKLLRFYISKDRKARIEILNAISNMNENEYEGMKAFFKNLNT